MRPRTAFGTPILLLCAALELAPEAPAGVSPGLHARISEAVARGKESLRGKLDGLVERQPGDYPVGRVAIVAAALLEAGLPEDDPSLLRALRYLEERRSEKTYDAACHILALGSILERRRMEDLGPAASGRPEAPPGPPGPDHVARSRVEALAGWLLGVQNPGHGSWTYGKPGPTRRHDFSNTQFAVLGLEIALEQGVLVPRESLLAVVQCFTRAILREKSAVVIEITPELSLKERLRGSGGATGRRYRLVPGGWAYTESRTRRQEPYPSMTAAGASCLLIALNELRERARAPVPPEAERALLSSYAWIAAHFEEFLTPDENLYYTLYSLEKVGDLARIERFGEHDWYAEGAEVLLEEERDGGGWGSYVNTSLALLFLTRATRRLALSDAPILVTGERGEAAETGDLVYLASLDGFLPAGELLRHLGSERDRHLISIGEEVVRNYPPDRAPELVPELLRLWTRPDSTTAFARRALLEVTGVRSNRREAYAAWQEQHERLAHLESRADVGAKELSSLFPTLEGARLRARAAALAGRRGLRSLAPILIRELDEPSAEYRQQLHGVLSLWFGSAVRAPASAEADAWERAAEGWRRWWDAEGAALLLEWERSRDRGGAPLAEGDGAPPSAARDEDGIQQEVPDLGHGQAGGRLPPR